MLGLKSTQKVVQWVGHVLAKHVMLVRFQLFCNLQTGKLVQCRRMIWNAVPQR